jgi:hypothetical protein
MRRGLLLLAVLAAPPPLRGQDTLPPTQGGRVRSLGLPVVRRPYIGVSVGLARIQESDLTAHLRAGSYRDLTLPTAGLLGVALEAYGGLKGGRGDVGGRLMFRSNLLRLGAGLDYNATDADAGLIVTVASPVRRGGIVQRSSELRLDVTWARRSSIALSLNYPLRYAFRGVTRPRSDHVDLSAGGAPPLPYSVDDPALASVLAEVRARALWLRRFTTPPLRGDRSATEAWATLTARLDPANSVIGEIRAYHAAVRRGFRLAVDDSLLGEAVATRAVGTLLDAVVFPYNRLLGQKKKKDTTREFAGHARGVFARWLVTQSGVAPARQPVVIHVFHSLLETIEAVRAEHARQWDESRLGWLPLQLALAPDDYDEQVELDSLVSRAVSRPLLHGNRLWYVHNQRFQIELVRSIARAEDYHVLWVHDFAGINAHGEPDRLSLYTVTQAYLGALRERVARYDSVGRLPVFMLFIDQHYFDKNRSRAMLAFLADPLHNRLDLPAGFDSLEAVVRDAQEALVAAVNGSMLLGTERMHYGDRWLRGLVKVHVSVTNPADPSFRSRWLLPVIGLPDDAIRDHRKIVLWDLSEQDPYRGFAMYTGAGVGEHYVGRAWEDRAVMLQGPAALSLRDEARALLESQGITGGSVPHVLRPHPWPADYWRRVRAEIDSMDRWGGVATRAMELHNETGYAWKRINVAKATIFNLAAPGAVIKVPDSLWESDFLASLLAGAALRGVRVLLIAPSLASAPSRGSPQLAVMHDLLAAALALRQTLGPTIDRAGGAYRVGIYDPDVAVDDVAARVDILRRRLAETPFLRDLYAFDAGTARVLDSARALVGAPPPQPLLPVTGDSADRPKLHFKGFLYVSREAWGRLVSGNAMATGLATYLVERGRQLREGIGVEEEAMAAALQRAGAQAINTLLDTLPLGERPRWAFFLMVGSANENYRSMLLDGEAMVLVSGWTSLYAVPDLILLTGIATWIDEKAELDRRLPPVGGVTGALGRALRMGL